MIACTACIDINFEYRMPYGGWALLVALIWFGNNAFRTTDESPKARRVLIFVGLMLATVWFTLCMFPLAWGGLLGIATGISAIRSISSGRSPSSHKQFAGSVVALLLGLAGFSIWTSRQTEHQIAWLGRLPTHGAENIRPVRVLRSRGESAIPLLIQSAQQEVNHEEGSWYHLGSLARELSRLPNPPCALMSQFRHRAVDLIEEDGFRAGMPALILACGQANSCRMSDSFEPMITERLNKDDPGGALLFLTAWGLSDRGAALDWAAQHDLTPLESSDSFSRNDDRAIHELWNALKAGQVDSEVVQTHIDRMTPACAR
jgi:hypothetical protein